MPDFDDSLGGQTLGGVNDEDRFEKRLGNEHTMGGDTDIEDDCGRIRGTYKNV
tara:strand:+ start:54 stop:212 length:159 start_codon:yes stop_codon:yes gene_type:complete